MSIPGDFIKHLRKNYGLSQRQLAGLSGISFRQIQRIEKRKSDISFSKFYNLLQQFGFDFVLSPPEPNWNILAGYGFALSYEEENIQNVSYDEFWKELLKAITLV